MDTRKFEQLFDDGVDLTGTLDLSKAKRVLQQQKRVNIDFGSAATLLAAPSRSQPIPPNPPAQAFKIKSSLI